MDPQILGPVCTTPSPPNCIGLQSPRPQGLRPRGLCLRNSLSVLHRQRTRRHSPGAPRVPRSLTHLPSALQRAMSCPAAPPPSSPSPPHNLTPKPPTSPNQHQVQNPHVAPLQTSIGASFPGPPPAGKTSREPSAEVCGPSGTPTSRVQGARAQGSSSSTSAPRGPRPPPETQPPQTSGPAFPQRLPGLAHLSDCFLLHRRADAAWV